MTSTSLRRVGLVADSEASAALPASKNVRPVCTNDLREMPEEDASASAEFLIFILRAVRSSEFKPLRCASVVRNSQVGRVAVARLKVK